MAAQAGRHPKASRVLKVKEPRSAPLPSRRKPGEMNKLERAYAEELERRRQSGQLEAWWFESVKLRLADGCWYTPDFFVLLPDGTPQFVETKGFWRDDAKVKFKVAAEHYPCFRWVVAKSVKGGWAEVEVFSE